MINKYVFNVKNEYDWWPDESFVEQIGKDRVGLIISIMTPDGPFVFRDIDYNIRYVSQNMRDSFQNYVNFAADLCNAEWSNIQNVMNKIVSVASESLDEKFNGEYRVLPITHEESTKVKTVIVRQSMHGKRILGFGTYSFFYPISNPAYQLLKPIDMNFIHDITDVFSDMDQRLFFRMYDLYLNSVSEIFQNR